MGDIVRSAKYPTNPTFTGATVSGIIAAAAGVITANTPALNISQTWNNAAINFDVIKVNVIDTAQSDSGNGSNLISLQVGGGNRFRVDHYGTIINNSRIYAGDYVVACSATAIPAGGTQDKGLLLGPDTNHLGIIYGSGAPTASMGQGSLYVRSDGPPQVNINGTTGWLPISNMSSAPSSSASGTSSTVGATDTDYVVNASGTYTLTLPTATAGRVLRLKSINAQIVNSASSNVIPLGGAQNAAAAIFSATAGKWAILVGNGTNWVIMAGN